MTTISITYTKNAKNRFDFIVEQNGVQLYAKAYSPRTEELQHFMGYALAEEANASAQVELKNNPDFHWDSFEEFKTWLGSPELRNKAITFYHEHESEWMTNPGKGW